MVLLRWLNIWGPFLGRPENVSARTDIRNSPTRLLIFCEAGLFICCKGNKNYYNRLQSFVPPDAFVLKIQRELLSQIRKRVDSHLKTTLSLQLFAAVVGARSIDPILE